MCHLLAVFVALWACLSRELQCCLIMSIYKCLVFHISGEEEDLYFAIQLSMQDMVNNPNSHSSCSQLTHDSYSLHPDAPAASRSVTYAIASSAAVVTSTSGVDDSSNCNVFGVIKDIRINNILAADADKTCQFDTKNFKQLFNHAPGSSPVNGLAPNLNDNVCDNNVAITRNEIDNVQ
jgi:hypothetical protein